MSTVRVILITVAGPRGHVDVGVRSDATPENLADALGTVIGVSPAATVIEHRSPPRPGVPDGRRTLVGPATALAEAGVADGDLVLFRTADSGGGYSWPEVQARPAEFGASSPPPRAAVLRSSPTSRPLVPAQAVPPAAEARSPDVTRPDEAPDVTRPDEAPDVTRPDQQYTQSPAAVAADPAATPPDVWTPASAQTSSDTDNGWITSAPPPASATDDVWPPAARADVWPIPAPRTPDAWTQEESGAADPASAADTTQPDIGRPPASKRFMTAPKLSEPTAGRHARGQPGAGEPEPESDLDEAQGWQADANGPQQQDQAWWRESQEVNPDD